MGVTVCYFVYHLTMFALAKGKEVSYTYGRTKAGAAAQEGVMKRICAAFCDSGGEVSKHPLKSGGMCDKMPIVLSFWQAAQREGRQAAGERKWRERNIMR